MKTGLIILLCGILLLAFAYFRYKSTENNLMPIKKDDLVAFYLELAYRLLPVPFWCACIGIVAVVTGLIWILVSIPLTF